MNKIQKYFYDILKDMDYSTIDYDVILSRGFYKFPDVSEEDLTDALDFAGSKLFYKDRGKEMKYKFKESKFNTLYENIITKFNNESVGDINESSVVENLKAKINSLDINLEPYDDLRRINIDDKIKMEYEVMSDQIYIEHIEVDKSLRGSGLAKLLLNKFLKAVDAKKLPVTLMVYPTDDVTEDELVQIYKKFGFYVYAKDKGNNKPLMRREINESKDMMIGYKVMKYEDGKAISGADSRQEFPLDKGKTVSMSGRGIFLTLDKQYAIDYYAQHEQNVVIKMEFDPSDVTGGNLTDKDTEFTVSKAKILDYEIINEDDF